MLSQNCVFVQNLSILIISYNFPKENRKIEKGKKMAYFGKICFLLKENCICDVESYKTIPQQAHKTITKQYKKSTLSGAFWFLIIPQKAVHKICFYIH